MRFTDKGEKLTEYISPEKLEILSLKNCVFENGVLKTRPSFEVNRDSFIFKADNSSAFDMSFMTSDCYITYKEKYGQVAVNIIDNLLGTITFNLLLISDDGEAVDLGYIEFSSNGEDFGYPDSFTVFSGKKTVADGIYFLSRRLYESGEELVSVRELDSESGVWRMLTESNIYAPVVLENGRGESYHFAEANGNPLNFPSPAAKEAKNLLSARFLSKYTTDGASFGFSLPYSQLDDAAISANITLQGKSYSFKIYSGSIVSDSTAFEDTNVVMYCDRAFGRIYFEKKDGGEFIFPLSSEYNNLTVTAYKTVKGHSSIVASMSSAKKLEGSAVSGGDAVTLFWGSGISPSSLILNSPKDPLYFPKSSEHILGGEETPVLSVLSIGKSLYVFKGNEIYKSEIKSANSTAIYPLSFARVGELPSVPLGATVARLYDKVLFSDNKGDVYELSPKGDYLSRKLCSLNTEVDFALRSHDKYLLIKADAIFTLQRGDDKYIKGEWKSELSCIGGMSSAAGEIFLFEERTNDAYIIRSGKLSKESGADKSEISFFIMEEKGETRLYSITLYGEGNEFCLTHNSADKKMTGRRARLSAGQAKVFLGGVSHRHNIELSFKESFALEKIKLEYKKKG